MSLSKKFKGVYKEYADLFHGRKLPEPNLFPILPPVLLAPGIIPEMLDPRLPFVAGTDTTMGSVDVEAGSYIRGGNIYDKDSNHIGETPKLIGVDEWNNGTFHLRPRDLAGEKRLLLPVGSVIFSRVFVAMNLRDGLWLLDGSSTTREIIRRKNRDKTIEDYHLPDDMEKFGKILSVILPFLVDPESAVAGKINSLQLYCGKPFKPAFHPIFFADWDVDKPQMAPFSGALLADEENHLSIIKEMGGHIAPVADAFLALEEYV